MSLNILAIDTSCDDTCLSIIKVKSEKSRLWPQFKILANFISSQAKIHQKWGGVYPNLAKREHEKNLVLGLEQVLKKGNLLKPKIKEKFQRSKFQIFEEILKREKRLLKQLKKFLKKYRKPKIDLIGITIGPGLEPCLWVGVNFVKALAFYWNLVVIPVNHIEGHILVNLLSLQNEKKIKLFPAICLVVSGGHTQLILMKKIGNYKIIGETRDDAAGECFDKTARILGLGYPGGPALAAAAAAAAAAPDAAVSGTKIILKSNNRFDHQNQILLPRPMLHQKNYDFSFSGLKTAVLYHFKKQPLKIRRSKKYIQAMATEIQQAIIDVLISKTLRAINEHKVKTLILGGGVIANQKLQTQFKEKIKKEFSYLNYLMPQPCYATDNAVMIGITASCYYLKEKRTKNWNEIWTDSNLGFSKEEKI